MRKSILTIVGARPQFIKCSILSTLLRKKFNEEIIHTGQHYDYNMSDSFFKILDIPIPQLNLSIGSYNHGTQTGKIMIALEKLFMNRKPDLVIVYGDTNSTLAGALAASKLNIKTCHIEAGLRSYNKSMPEEINRICTDHISDLLFCPSELSVNNLKKENILNNVYDVGDVMKDIYLGVEKKLDIAKELRELELSSDEAFYFMTIHRQENTDNINRLISIFELLSGAKNKIIFSIHPRTKKIIKENNLKMPSTIIKIEPVNYLKSVALQKSAKIIITDSGGIQKEAFFSKTPCITLRKETEWKETVEYGYNILVDVDKNKFKKAEEHYLNNKNNFDKKNLYGNGFACKKIFDVISNQLNK